jgi:hypothetical protein
MVLYLALVALIVGRPKFNNIVDTVNFMLAKIFGHKKTCHC